MNQLAIVAALAVGLSAGPLAVGPFAGSTAAAETKIPVPVQLDDDDDKAQAKAEVLVIHADNSGKGIDPRLKHLKQLTQPPFNAYDSYWLIETKTMDLTQGEAAEAELPDKGKLKLALKEVVKPSEDKPKTRYVVKASITKSNGKMFLPGLEVNANEDEIFFVAGQKYKNGILVLGIRIKKK
jgi:hypothetical protein